MTAPAKHISIAIDRQPDDVYNYASNLANLREWAIGIGENISVHFVGKNNFGVMDHYVTLPTGETFYIAFRVIPNREGSEVLFTIFKHPGISDDDFLKDCLIIAEDLARLKGRLEKNLTNEMRM
jgi:hypothetical protein